MMRYILITHRYLAVLVGLLMTLWCLSGFVMMYQSFPELSQEQRLAGLEPLDLTQCCSLGSFAPHDDSVIGDFRIEMLLGEPVLRMGGRDASTIIRLASGEPLAELTDQQILAVAAGFGQGNGVAGRPQLQGVIEIDQWTLQSARRNQPAWHVRFDDAARTEIYINGRTGEVFQHTNRRERVLSWFGAIPHWLYPTVLRQNGPLWTEVVIWTSVLGTFLAATGLYVGISRMRQRTEKRPSVSPFKGWWYWHHISGLVFGVLVLTWVFSGLMTMNPWGMLSGDASSSREYRSEMTGSARWAELRQVLSAVNNGALQDTDHARIKQLTPAVFGGQLFVMASRDDLPALRLNSRAEPAPLAVADIENRLQRLTPARTDAGLLYREDNYYYGHKREVALPVYRAIMDDAERTRLYINLETGAVRTVSSTGRWSRWIRTGLHDLDFPVLRLRPIWDIVVIFLLLGVTGVCATGTWMARRRIRRDYRSWHRRSLTQ